eukprot:scaffold43238_cov66-Phaeocystis_antarctica.AAC.2
MREGTAGARPPAVHLLASLAARLWWQLSLRQEPRSRASCSLSRLSVSLISKRKPLNRLFSHETHQAPQRQRAVAALSCLFCRRSCRRAASGGVKRSRA